MAVAKTIALFILSILCVHIVGAQPRLSVQPEMDWGRVVPKGAASDQQRVKARIILKNVGDAILHIRDVRPSCGCVTAPLDRDSIAPNEEAFVDVTMNFPVANGPLSKTLTIHTNEPIDSMHSVVLKAELVRPLQLSSSFVPFNKGVVGESVEGELTITSYADIPVTLTVAPLTKGATVVSRNPVVLTTGVPETVRLRFSPIQAGPYRVDLELRTTLAGYEAIPISGFGVADERPVR